MSDLQDWTWQLVHKCSCLNPISVAWQTDNHLPSPGQEASLPHGLPKHSVRFPLMFTATRSNIWVEREDMEQRLLVRETWGLNTETKPSTTNLPSLLPIKSLLVSLMLHHCATVHHCASSLKLWEVKIITVPLLQLYHPPWCEEAVLLLQWHARPTGKFNINNFTQCSNQQ